MEEEGKEKVLIEHRAHKLEKCIIANGKQPSFQGQELENDLVLKP